MYPLFCNKCFEQKKEDSTIQFYFSSCEHVLCKNCIDRNCAMCGRPYHPIRICKEMPAQMATFFANSKKLYGSFQRSMKFQIEQDALLFKYYYEAMPTLFRKLQKERNALLKVEKQISTTLSVENQRIGKLKKYLAYNERRLEQINVNPIPRSQPLLRTESKARASSIRSAATSPALSMISRYHVQTPTLSLPDSNEELLLRSND